MNKSSSARHAVFAFGIAALLVATGEMPRYFFTDLTTGDQYYQNFAFPVVALLLARALLRRRRGEVEFAFDAAGLVAAGALAGATLALFHVFGKVALAYYGTMAAICAWAAGVYGRRAFAAMWPALIFLFLMVPFHIDIVTKVFPVITLPERMAAAWVAAKTAVLLGIPAVPHGTDVVMEHFTMKVVVACSGLTYIVGTLAAVVAFLALSEGPGTSKFYLVALAPVISMACNAARVTGNVLVAGFFGNRAALWYFHDISGLLYVFLIVMLIMWVGDALGLEIPKYGRRQ